MRHLGGLGSGDSQPCPGGTQILQQRKNPRIDGAFQIAARAVMRAVALHGFLRLL